MPQNIKHIGTVESIDDLWIKVKINQSSACSACVAKKLCNSSEFKEKIIDVPNENSLAISVAVGEQVVVTGSLSQGLLATFWAYVLPLILMVTSLFISIYFFKSELLGAFSALGAVVLYCLFLYLFRKELASKFVFSITKINQ